MLKFYFSLFVLLCSADSIFAQNPVITIDQLNPACLNTVYKIPVTIAGKFDTGNVFKVQIRENQYEPRIWEFPATLTDGKIEVIFTDPQLLTFSNLQLRILSTAPVAASEYAPYSFTIHSKGNISVSNFLSDTLNRYEPLNLSFSGESNSRGIVTLQDSTRFDFFGSANSPFLNFGHQLYPAGSGTYSIAHAENTCGVMTVSGQAKVVINQISVRTTQLTPLVLCPGSELKVNFTTDGTIPQSAKYKIRLLEVRIPNEMPQALKYELTATLRDGALYATIPDNLNITQSTYFYVNVLVNNPGIVGNYGNMNVLISPKPSAEVTSESVEVEMGNYVRIKVRYSGPSPSTINLTDGTEIVWTDIVSAYQEHELYRTPSKTTDYAVKSIESGCQQAKLPAKVMRVTVKPGFYLDQVNTDKNYCEGETVRLHFLSNVTVPASAVFTMEIGFNGKSVSVPVKRDGEFAEFKIPTFPDDPVLRNNRYKTFTFLLSSVNPGLKSFRIDGITIQGKPTIAWSKENTTVFPGPVHAKPTFWFFGGGPYDVTFKNEKKDRYIIYQEWATAQFYVPASGSFGIKSISNSCFSNEDLPGLNLKIENPASAVPVISAITNKFNICHTDSLEIDINVAGKFEPGNVFEIQMTDGVSFYTFTTFAKVSGSGKIKIKIPEEGTYKISTGTTEIGLRVASTNPVIYSETFGVSLNYPLYSVSLGYSDRVDKGQEMPNMAQINYLGSLPSSLVYSDDKTDHTVPLQGNGYYASFPLNSVPGKNTYTLKTITSVCGTQDLNLPMSVLVLPYRIRISYMYGYPFICAGNTITIPFSIWDAEPVAASFSLQIQKTGGEYIEIGKGTSMKEISGTIPADFPAGNYYNLRIISNEGVISNSMSAQIGAAPTATISVKDQNGTGPVTVNAGQSVFIQINLTGSLPQWVVADGLYDYNRESSPINYSVSPNTSGEFVIKSVRNACGYGTFTGSVAVKVLPTLTADISNYIQCVDSPVLLNYNLKGNFDLGDDYIRFDLIDHGTQKKYSLDSTRISADAKLIKIPETVPGGNYTLVTSVKKYGLKIDNFIQLMTTPNVALLGTTVINQGEQTNLLIKSNGFINSQPVSYKLSNGYAGQFSDVNPEGAFITVAPAVTSEYTITSVYNQCGTGTFSGKAIVVVNPFSEKSLTVTNWKSAHSLAALCTRDSIQVYFNITGKFSNENRFTVQLSDSTGQNFQSIPTSGNSSPLVAVIPGTIPRGSGYRLKVIASDAETASGTFKNPLDLRMKASARFASEIINYQPDTNPKAIVLLEGDSPYNYVYGTDLVRDNKYTELAVDSLILYQASPSLYYKLFSVQNVCGIGTIGNPSTVRVELITGIEEPVNQMQITVMPNPTSDFVTLKFSAAGPRKASIYSVDGKLWLNKSVTRSEEKINLQGLPLGIFILSIDFGSYKKSFKIIKQ
jgi:hypothetical protein